MMLTIIIAVLGASIISPYTHAKLHQSSDSYYCNIPILNLDAISKYFTVNGSTPKYPMIFTDANYRTKHSQLLRIGSKESLILNHGNTVVHLTSSNTYSQGDYSMTLSEYISHWDKPASLSNESYYLFGNNYLGIWEEFTETYQIPSSCMYCDKAGAKTFGLGGRNSGVSWHFHGPGFSEVIYGRKRWFLYPPQVKSPPGHHPNMTVAEWVDKYRLSPVTSIELDGTVIDNDVSNDYDLKECIISPGDLLFFPTGWMHATLNLDDYNLFVSVFLDTQLMHP